MEDLNVLGEELKDFLSTGRAYGSRLLSIEQKLTAPNGGDISDGDDVGAKVICSPEWKSFQQANQRTTGRIRVGSFHTKSNLINATGLNQPLVPAFRRPGIVRPGEQTLGIRDLLPSSPIGTSMIEWAKEDSFTNAAAMQTAESVAKGESAAAFSLSYSPVQTLAHWIPVSRQLLDDAPAIQGYVNSRLMYFLKLVEEAQLLSGNGVGTNLSGLIANATTFDTSQVTVATDSYIDILQEAITQVTKSKFNPDGVIVNPLDWSRIQRIKTVGTASSGEYIFSDPHSVQAPRIWGLPVVQSWSMPESQFMVGAFGMAAMIWDRNDATIEVSREHSDFFVRNMAALLCEERLALTVFRSDALVYGGFPFGS
jgi:HK97 family phage major capsid protein